MTPRMHAMGASTNTHAHHNLRGAQLGAEIWMNDWLPINGFAEQRFYCYPKIGGFYGLIDLIRAILSSVISCQFMDYCQSECEILIL